MATYKDGKVWGVRGTYRIAKGEYKQYKRTGFPTKKAAAKFEMEFKGKNRNNNYQNSLLLSELVSEYTKVMSANRKESTILTKNRVYSYVVKSLNDPQINDIDRIMLTNYFNSLNKQGYSINYIDKIYSCISSLLSYAVKVGYLEDNPIRKVDKIKRLDEVKKEMIVWTIKDFNQFISVIENHDDICFFTMLQFTGMRKGELYGLTWNDVDLHKRTINIKQQWNIKSRKITTPKTKNSVRKIKIPDRLFSLLEEKYEKDSDMYCFKTSWFLFGYTKVVSDTNMVRKLNRYIQQAKVNKISMHGFRHNHASLLINNDCNVLAVAHRLGDTVDTVLSTYAHMFKSTEDELINVLNNV